MDRRSYKTKPQHLITDPRSGEIKRIVNPADTDIGTPDIAASLRVFGDLTIKGALKNADGGTFIAGGSNITVTSASNGQVTISAVAASGASAALSYVTVAVEGTLTSERVLTGGTGIKVVDGGANTTVTMNINDGVVATVSGTNFSGVVKATGGLSGSLQQTVGGLSFLVGGTNVTVSSASNGQVTISAAAASGAPSTAQYITLATDGTLSAERVLVPSTGLFSTDGGANGNYTIGVNDRFFAALTGSNFTGPTTYSAAATFSGGISGSLTKLQDGTSYIIAGSNVTVTTGSGGQITISSTGGGSGGGGDPDPQYLTLALTASLSSERVFTPGTGLKATDGGANGNYTLSVNDGVVAMISGSTFTGAVTGASNGGFTGSMTRLVGGTPFITVPAGNVVTMTTGSGGQIVISGSGGGNEGAPKSAQFLTLAADPELTVERVFTPGTGLKATDGGAGAVYTLNINDGVVATISGSTFTGAITAAAAGGITGSITQTTAGTPFITVPAGNGISITTGSNGQIILSGSSGGSGSGAPTSAQYITLAIDATLTAERVFTPSTGLKATDGGANGNYTLIVHDGTFAALTGSVFTGVVQHSSPAQTLGIDVFTFFSGSVRVVPGTSAVVSANRKVSLFGGDIVASGSLVLSGAASFDGQTRYPSALGTDVFHYVSGSIGVASGYNRQVTVLAGDVVASGSITAALAGGITGSITVTSAGTPFITAQAGNAITVTTGSNGQVILSASISGGTGAPTTSPYVTIGNDASLSAERALTAGTGILITDAGANSTVTLKVDDNKFAALTGSNFTGAVSFDAGGVSALTKGTDVFNWFSGSATKDGGPSVTTQNRKVSVFGGDVVSSGSFVLSGAASFDSQLRTASFFGTDVYHFVSGTFGPTSSYQRRVALFGGDVVSSGSFQANFFSGSIQKTFGGLSYLVASGAVTITSKSNGQVFIFAPSGGGSVVGSDKQVIFNDGGSAYNGNANFTFDKVLGAVSASILHVPDHIDLAGGTGPVATTGSIRTGYTGDANLPLWSVLDSNLADRTIISYGGDVVTFGSTAQTRIYGSVTQFYDSGGGLMSEFYPGLGYIGGVPHSFDSSPGFTQAAAYGTDNWLWVSGSRFTDFTVDNPERKVAVFGGDVHISGTLRFSPIYLQTSDLLKIDYVPGVDQVFLSVDTLNSVFTWGSTNWYNTYQGYGVVLNGPSTGVTIQGSHLLSTTPSSFAPDSVLASTIGTDVTFYVSGSRNTTPARSTDVDPVSVDRHVTVFGGDMVSSGSISLVSTSGDDGNMWLQQGDAQYAIFNGNLSSQMWFGDPGFNVYVRGYSANLYGYTNGVSSYDGRSAITTDLTIASQRLSTVFITSSNVTVGNTKAGSATPFTLTAQANEIWFVEMSGMSTNTIAGGISFSILAPTGSMVEGWAEGALATGPTTVQRSQIRNPNSGSAPIDLFNTANVTGSVKIWGTVQVGANAGAIGIGIGSWGAGTVRLFSGSYFRAQRATNV